MHIVAEFSGIERKKLEDVTIVEAIMNKVASEAKLNVIHKISHQFKPSGASIIYMISESHISIHTWPEHNYAAVDIFTCGEEGNAEDAYKVFVRELKPKKIRRKIFRLKHLEKLQEKNPVKQYLHE